MRQQVEEADADGRRDDDVHEERARRPEPHRGACPRDASTSDANIDLSGSSPRKITGNTASTIDRCIRANLREIHGTFGITDQPTAARYTPVATAMIAKLGGIDPCR